MGHLGSLGLWPRNHSHTGGSRIQPESPRLLAGLQVESARTTQPWESKGGQVYL